MRVVEVSQIRFRDLSDVYNLIYSYTQSCFIENPVVYLQSPNPCKVTARAAVMARKRNIAVPLTRIREMPYIVIKGI